MYFAHLRLTFRWQKTPQFCRQDPCMSDTATPEVNWVHKVCFKFLVVYLVDNIYLTLLRKQTNCFFGGYLPNYFSGIPQGFLNQRVSLTKELMNTQLKWMRLHRKYRRKVVLLNINYIYAYATNQLFLLSTVNAQFHKKLFLNCLFQMFFSCNFRFLQF